MVERNDRHILHKVFTDVIPEEVQRNVLRDALEKAGAKIESVRPEKRRAKTEALERWFDQFQRGVPVQVGGSVTQLRDQLLKHFPRAIMTDLGRGDIRAVGRNAKGYEAILREQEDAREALSPTESEALTWKQNKQIRALAPWYSYLTTNDAAGEFKDIPWFRAYVVSTISSTLKKVVDGKASTVRRESDTRDEVPHFDAGILALVYDKVKAQLHATHFNGRKQQEQFVPNWDIDFWGLWAEATTERIAQGEKYKEKVPQNDWLKITDPAFLSEVSVHTPWCLAGKSTAESYLTPDIVDGETYPKAVWVFFDENKSPAIGLHACEIGENQWEIRQIRGADDSQHLREALSVQLDTFINGKKVHFTNAGNYREQIHDHHAVTELSRHIILGTFERLPEMEQKRLLKTLYEIDRPIQSFGYGQDDRVTQLRGKRDGAKDAEIIFGKEHIARTLRDTKDTQRTVFIGNIRQKDFFRKLPKHITHVFDQSLDKQISLTTLDRGEAKKDGTAYLQWLEEVRDIDGKPFTIGDYPRKMLLSPEFVPSGETSDALVTVSVDQLFADGKSHTFKDILARASEYGLGVCPHEVGPLLRAQLKNQREPDYLVVAVNPLRVDGSSLLFYVDAAGGTRWLDGYDGYPGGEWSRYNRFVFVRKS